MGIYGHALDRDRQYTSVDLLSDLDKSFYAAESVIDNWLFQNSILQEANDKEETGLVFYTSAKDQYEEKEAKEKEEKIAAEKGKLSHRLKEMIISFLKWFKEIWDKLVSSVKAAIEKMKSLTLRDKAMNKLFSNFKYDQVQQARDNGWKGLLYETTVMCIPADMSDSEIIRLLRNSPDSSPKDINQKVYAIANADSLEKAESLYSDIKADCDKLLKNPDTKVHDAQQIQKNRTSIFADLNRMFGIDEDNGKAFFVYMSIQNPNDKRFGWPDQSQFNQCKMLALDGEKYVNSTRRNYYNDHIKDLENIVNIDINRILDSKLENDFYSPESNKITGYYYKAMLLSDKTQLTLQNRICTEIIKVINFQIKTSIQTFVKIMSGVKAYTLVHSKKDSKSEPEPEPEASEA